MSPYVSRHGRPKGTDLSRLSRGGGNDRGGEIGESTPSNAWPAASRNVCARSSCRAPASQLVNGRTDGRMDGRASERANERAGAGLAGSTVANDTSRYRVRRRHKGTPPATTAMS